MRKPIQLCVTVAVLLACFPVASQSIAEATAMRQSGDLKAAFEMYEKLANQGNAEAQFQVGFFYETGQVVPQSYLDAEIWYKKSALQGFVKAQSSLAWIYANGKGGVKKDVVQAAVLYEKAAAQGDTIADGSLYSLHSRNPGLSNAIKNYKEAEVEANRRQAQLEQQQSEEQNKAAQLKQESLACLDKLYNDARTKSLAGKLLIDTSKTASMELMANNARPTARDKPALSYVVSEWERCIDIQAEPQKKNLLPQVNQLIAAYRLDLRSAFSDLYGGKTSYGELAKARAKLDLDFNHKLDTLVASLQAKELAEARQKQEAEAQKRYAEAQNQQQREAEQQRQAEARRQLDMQEAQLRLTQQQAQQQSRQQQINFLQNMQLQNMLNQQARQQAQQQSQQQSRPSMPMSCTSTRLGTTVTTNCF